MGKNDWWRGFEKKDEQSFVGIHGTRCFSSMFSSMPKGEIVRRLVGSMNADDIPMGEYCRYVTMMICYIHV